MAAGRKVEWLGHPVGIFVLFATEMWERFSYYGMRALLIFYMTETFLFSDDKSYAIYGSYTALVYLTPVFGGFIADRWLGYRKAVIVGAVLMSLGHFCMAVEDVPIFYLALSLLIIGNGFFKPNMSTVVGKLYAEGDPRRDGGFTIFYMGVNVGALLSPIGCGYVGKQFGWHWGFTLAGFGMVLGLVLFVLGQKTLEGHGEPPDPARLGRSVLGPLKLEGLIYVGAAVAVVLGWQLIQFNALVEWALPRVGVLMVLAVIVYSFRSCDRIARQRLWVALSLTVFSIAFWAAFEQAGSSLNLFADRNVDTAVAGWEIPAPVMQSINPIFIVMLGPVFAALWVGLSRRGLNPSIPLKFGLGLLQLGLGFAALYYGASISQHDGIVALGWLVLGYFLHTTGELCLSPVGLSMITKLSPPTISGLMMGMWYLAISYANIVASQIARLTGVESDGATQAVAPVDTVMVYGSVFGQIALTVVVVGLVVTVVSPLLNRGTHGVA